MTKWVDIYKTIRKVWLINPKTKVRSNKKIYNRKRAKKELIRRLREEEIC